MTHTCVSALWGRNDHSTCTWKSSVLMLAPSRQLWLLQAISKEGWKLVTLLRLSPLIPWSLLNYALSITGEHLCLTRDRLNVSLLGLVSSS